MRCKGNRNGQTEQWWEEDSVRAASGGGARLLLGNLHNQIARATIGSPDFNAICVELPMIGNVGIITRRFRSLRSHCRTGLIYFFIPFYGGVL